MVTIIIPSYQEIYLNRTLEDILEKAKGDIEVLVHVDKGLPEGFPEQNINDERVIFKYANTPVGMRAGINWGLSEAQGDYIMKVDAHCVFDEGFDVKLLEDMQDNWLVVPRRYALHADNWDRVTTLPIKDYHYLTWPWNSPSHKRAMYPVAWNERTDERKDIKEYIIDDTMSIQGSFWLAKRDYFMKHVGFLQEEGYSTFSGEQIETGMKYWLGGGEVKVNKKTWYAHLFKNKRYYGGVETHQRDYKRDLKNHAGYRWYTKHWINNQEPNMIHTFEWLVDKFWPLPNWPDNWKEIAYGIH